MEMPHLNRKLVCAAETAHDVGKVDGCEETEQVKDDDPLLPVLNRCQRLRSFAI